MTKDKITECPVCQGKVKKVFTGKETDDGKEIFYYRRVKDETVSTESNKSTS